MILGGYQLLPQPSLPGIQLRIRSRLSTPPLMRSLINSYLRKITDHFWPLPGLLHISGRGLIAVTQSDDEFFSSGRHLSDDFPIKGRPKQDYSSGFSKSDATVVWQSSISGGKTILMASTGQCSADTGHHSGL